MSLKSIVHPGESVAAALKELGLTIVEAAEALSVSRQTVHNVISGRSGVTADMAYRLEKALGKSTAEDWLALQTKYDLAQVLAHPPRLPRRRSLAPVERAHAP